MQTKETPYGCNSFSEFPCFALFLPSCQCIVRTFCGISFHWDLSDVFLIRLSKIIGFWKEDHNYLFFFLTVLTVLTCSAVKGFVSFPKDRMKFQEGRFYSWNPRNCQERKTKNKQKKTNAEVGLRWQGWNLTLTAGHITLKAELSVGHSQNSNLMATRPLRGREQFSGAY